MDSYLDVEDVPAEASSSFKRKREAPQAPNPYIPLTEDELSKKFVGHSLNDDNEAFTDETHSGEMLSAPPLEGACGSREEGSNV